VILDVLEDDSQQPTSLKKLKRKKREYDLDDEDADDDEFTLINCMT
jgi:hypothetical protein